MLSIRVFRAIDDLKSCEKFAEGHANVLKDYGVTKVTSARTDWFFNPGVYVVLVEDEETMYKNIKKKYFEIGIGDNE